MLTAGIATRLRPLSLDRAKASVPVAGEPLVRRILRWLIASGVSDLVLNLHHRPETVTRVVGDGSDLGCRVRYSFENPILGSAGAAVKALPLFDNDPLLIVNGDTLTDVNLRSMAAAHRASGALVTMALIPNPDPDRYGGVVVDDGGRVLGFTRLGQSLEGYHFIGVQLASRSVFAGLEPDRRVESVNGVYPQLIAREPGAIHAFVSDAMFLDVGTPGDYLATSLAVARAEGASAPLWGRNVSVAPGARVSDTIIWDDVTVEAATELTRCVIGDGVRIPAGSRYLERAIVRADGRTPSAVEERAGDLLIAPLDQKAVRRSTAN